MSTRTAYRSVTRAQIREALLLDLTTLDDSTHILRLPAEADFQYSAITELLITNLKYALELHGLRNEASRSLVVVEFLKDALISFGNRHLHIVPQSRERFKNEDHVFSGIVDYSIGTKDLVSQLLVIEVKAGMDREAAETQLLVLAGCVLRRRLAETKATPVFAVLTDGAFFQFYAIDNRDSTVYSSRVIYLDYRANPDFASYGDLKEVVTWFRWFLTLITAVSPRSSPPQIILDGSQDSLEALRRDFRLH